MEVFECADSICCFEDDEFAKSDAKGLDSLRDGKFTSKGLVRGVTQLGKSKVGVSIRWTPVGLFHFVNSVLIPDELPFWTMSSEVVRYT